MSFVHAEAFLYTAKPWERTKLKPSGACMRQLISSSLVQIMACRLFRDII